MTESSPREKQLRRLLEMLHFYSDAFARIPLTNEQEVCRTAVTLIASVLSYQAAAVVFDPDVWPSAGHASKGLKGGALTGARAAQLLSHLRAEVDAPCVWPDSGRSPAVAALLEELGLGPGVLAVPLRATVAYREERVGFALAAQPRREQPDTGADLVLLDIVSSLATGAMSNCLRRLELVSVNRALEHEVAERQRAEQALRFIVDVTKALSSTLDPRVIVEALPGLAVPRFADGCALVLLGDRPPAEVTGLAHRDPARAEPLREWALRTLLDAQVLEAREPLLLPPAPAAIPPAGAQPGPGSSRGESPASLLAFPLTSQQRVRGALFFTREQGRPAYGGEDVLIAQELARQVSIALAHAELYQEAREARRRAEEANRAKDEFLAIVSHELRTPLTSVLSWTQMLRAGRLSGHKQERALEAVERNARAQKQLVEDLLDISRITTGKLRLEVRPFEPVQAVEAALEAVRLAASAKGVELFTSLDREVGTLVGDPDRLQQVVWNLLTNAIKFTPPGGRVLVALRRADAEMELEVTDTGEGISEDFLPYLFDRFRQADSTSSRAHGGLGLGLAIVRHLVELHGGRVTASSPGRGKGATFRVRIPLRAEVLPEASDPMRAGEHAGA